MSLESKNSNKNSNFFPRNKCLNIKIYLTTNFEVKLKVYIIIKIAYILKNWIKLILIYIKN